MKRESVCKIFSNIPVLTTERVILRKITIDDVEDMFEYSKEADVTEYLTWSPHPDRSYTLEYVNYLQSRYRSGDFYDWGVVLRESGKMIGTCGFTRFDYANNSAEIGYVLNPAFHGLGIATEVAQRVIEFGFDNLGLNRIECKFIIGNDASRRVMEKNSMTFEGVRREGMLIKGRYRDIGVCSVLRSEYYCNKGNPNCKKGN
ncbi:MAG: GNAT family N-acetyltransferase [Clostridia bacterium]|nr:GNAT family N-acetyltransferase [Clostridia bacterium]